jgi:YggT family protein
VNATLSGLAGAYAALRLLVLAAAIVAAAACLLAWLVRTRRISPFSPLARLSRRFVDPMLAPIERRVVRMGGVPSSAPWWLLAAVVVGGIVLLSLVQFVVGQILFATSAVGRGPAGIVALLVRWTFAVLQIALIARVLSSWVGGGPHSKWFRWAFVLTEPILRPLRRVIPNLGMIDITPIVAYFGLVLLEGVILGAL